MSHLREKKKNEVEHSWAQIQPAAYYCPEAQNVVPTPHLQGFLAHETRSSWNTDKGAWKNVTYVTVTWIWSLLINSTRVNFPCNKMENRKLTSILTTTSTYKCLWTPSLFAWVWMFVTTVTIQMFRIFHRAWPLSITVIISLLSDIRCLPGTHTSLKETELQRQRLAMLYDLDMHHQSTAPTSATPCRKICTEKENPGRWYNKITTNCSCIRLWVFSLIFLISYSDRMTFIIKKNS